MATPQYASEDDTLFSIGETAALTGVSPHTIRAWERRYSMISPRRTRSRHRRYSEADVQVLREVREQVRGRGLSVGTAVRLIEREARSDGTAAPQRQQHARAGHVVQLDVFAGDIWHAVMNLIPDLFVLLDGTGRIVAANVAVAKLVGEVRERLSGLRFTDLVEPYDRAKAVTLYRQPLRACRDWELNLRTAATAGFYTFDCWPLSSDPALLALVGREVSTRHAQPMT